MFYMNFEGLDVILVFQVIKNGKVMFWTQHESCVPSEEEIKEMKKAGYKVKMKEDNEYDRRKE